MKFNQILTELIDDTGISAKKLAKQIGIPSSSIYLYLNGSYPNIKNAVKIANFFNCTLNYLFGLDIYPNEYTFTKNYSSEKFFDKYLSLLKNNNISHYKLSNVADINNSSYRLWKQGKEPKLETLIKIADYFGVSIDYLVGRAD